MQRANDEVGNWWALAEILRSQILITFAQSLPEVFPFKQRLTTMLSSTSIEFKKKGLYTFK